MCFKKADAWTDLPPEVVSFKTGGVLKSIGTAGIVKGDVNGHADEVRHLSQRCAQAAGETTALIEDSIGKTKDGKIKLDQVAGAIRSITESTQSVQTLVDRIQGASAEQARGIQRIAAALSQMEKVTQQTAQSRTLKANVSTLVSIVHGAS